MIIWHSKQIGLKHNTGNYDKDYSRIYNDFLIDWVRTTYVDDFKFFSYDTKASIALV